MECRKAEYLIHAYLDGELEIVGNYEFERHIAECAPCSERLEKEQALRRRFADGGLRFRSPPELQSRVETALAREKPVATVELPPRMRRGVWVATVAAAAMVVVAGLVALRQSPSTDTLLAQQIRDGHVRSLMAGHLMDVDSSDQHTVKPWFAGRLDFAPWTANLSDEGFPLQGGRLDYIDNRRVAALVFKRREHVINLFVWPDPASDTQAPRFVRQSNFQMVHWTRAGMTYWAVSDLNAAELSDFVALVQSRVSPAVQPAPPTTNTPGDSTGR